MANVKAGTGEQLFMMWRVGYHFQFVKSFFLEPSFAVTTWPINNGLPPSFQEKEDSAPKYAVEPGLHLGFLFQFISVKSVIQIENLMRLVRTA